MRKALVSLGVLLLFVAGAATGYLFALSQRPPVPEPRIARPASLDQPRPGAVALILVPKPAPETAARFYTDEEVAAMRKKLPELPLPVSRDLAFALLGIDPKRIDERPDGRSQAGHDVIDRSYWRLSPRFGLAMYSEFGPAFGPEPPPNRPFTRVVIARLSQPFADMPHFFVVPDEDREKTEVSLPRPGKGTRWDHWKYPSARIISSIKDHNDVAGGFACSTGDDFDKVLHFYYEKCGVPVGTLERVVAPFTTPDGVKVEVMKFRGFDNNTAGAVQARLLNLKMPDHTVSIAVVRAQGQKETQIFVNCW